MYIFTRFSKVYQRVISVFILIVLSAQATTLVVAQLIEGRGTTGSRYWPILVYDMYAKARHEGDIVDVHFLLEGVTVSGRVINIPQESLGLDFWHYVTLTRSLANGNPGAMTTLSGLLHQHYPEQQFTEIRIKSYPLKLTQNGAVPAESVVIHKVAVPAYEE